MTHTPCERCGKPRTRMFHCFYGPALRWRDNAIRKLAARKGTQGLTDTRMINVMNTHLLGQLFNRNGTNYLVVATSGSNRETVKVRVVDSGRTLIELPLQVVLHHLSSSQS